MCITKNDADFENFPPLCQNEVNFSAESYLSESIEKIQKLQQAEVWIFEKSCKTKKNCAFLKTLDNSLTSWWRHRPKPKSDSESARQDLSFEYTHDP